MKRVLVFYLALMQVFVCSPLAHASPESDAYEAAVKQMRATRDHLEKNFYPLVHTSTKNGIATQYTYTLWDHLAARDILRMKAEAGLSRLSRLRQEFGEHRAALFASGADWDYNASQALARAAHVQSAAIEAAQIVRDAQALEESWLAQCERHKLERTAGFADPLTYWDIRDEKAPATPKPHYEIGVRVTVDSGGNFQGASGGNANGQMVNWEDTLLTVAYATWEIPVVGWIISIVCVVVWGLVKLGRLTHEAGKLGSLKGELYDMQRQIRQIQLDALERVSKETPAIVADTCKTMFPQSSAKHLNLEVYGKYQEQAAGDLKTIAAQSQEIVQAFQDRYKNLVQVYYPAVKTTYAGLIEARLKQTVKTEEQIRLVLTNVFEPLFVSFEDVQKNEGLGKWAAQYEIWGATITTDALFRSQPGFSLVNAPGAESEDTVSKFGNSWNGIGPKMKGIFK